MSRFGGDHMSVGCGGTTLILDNSYRLPRSFEPKVASCS